MSSCPDCGNREGLCQRCRMEDLEARHGTTTDEDSSTWVLGEEWHASMWFDDSHHTCACGTTIETPLNWTTEDLRHVPDEHDAVVCDDCIEYLEEANDSRLETLPDGGEFERASKLCADGGEVDVYQWVLESIHEYPAGTDQRWGSRGNLIHQGRKLGGVTKNDVQAAIARAVDNGDLLSWHGLLARAEIDRLRELVRVEHEEHDITRQILVGKCNKLIATKKQEQADEESETKVATDGGRVQSAGGTDQSNRRKSVQPQGHFFPVPIGRNTPSGSSREAIGFPQFSQITTVVGCSCNDVIDMGSKWSSFGLNRTRIQHTIPTHLLRSIFQWLHRTLQSATERDGGSQ